MRNSIARAILFERGISLAKAADYCGVSRPFLSMVLLGTKKPSQKVRYGLSKLLNVSQKKLFNNTKIKSYIDRRY